MACVCGFGRSQFNDYSLITCRMCAVMCDGFSKTIQSEAQAPTDQTNPSDPLPDLAVKHDDSPQGEGESSEGQSDDVLSTNAADLSAAIQTLTDKKIESAQVGNDDSKPSAPNAESQPSKNIGANELSASQKPVNENGGDSVGADASPVLAPAPAKPGLDSIPATETESPSNAVSQKEETNIALTPKANPKHQIGKSTPEQQQISASAAQNAPPPPPSPAAGAGKPVAAAGTPVQSSPASAQSVVQSTETGGDQSVSPRLAPALGTLQPPAVSFGPGLVQLPQSPVPPVRSTQNPSTKNSESAAKHVAEPLKPQKPQKSPNQNKDIPSDSLKQPGLKPVLPPKPGKKSPDQKQSDQTQSERSDQKRSADQKQSESSILDAPNKTGAAPVSINPKKEKKSAPIQTSQKAADAVVVVVAPKKVTHDCNCKCVECRSKLALTHARKHAVKGYPLWILLYADTLHLLTPSHGKGGTIFITIDGALVFLALIMSCHVMLYHAKCRCSGDHTIIR